MAGKYVSSTAPMSGTCVRDASTIVGKTCRFWSAALSRVSRGLQWLSARPEWSVLAVCLLHRLILFWRMRPALLALVAQVPYFQVMQLLPVEIYRRHFWTGLWLLQQTPPIGHVLFRLVLLAGGWPYRTAELLCSIQGVTVAFTAYLLCLLIRKATGNRFVATVGALWFALSTDLVVSEYAFFGQVFYETFGMLIVTNCCYQGYTLASPAIRKPIVHAVALGALAAMAALTRSSLSLLPVAIGVAGSIRWRRRILIAYLAPVLILQGGWCLKNWAVFGRLTPETSSWGGMNEAKGVFWSQQGQLLCHDVASSPPGRYPEWFRSAAGQCRFAFAVAAQETLPAQLRAEDDAMSARFGGIRPTWNLPSVAAEADAWQIAVGRFSVEHPLLLARRFVLGYKEVWQRIADHAAQFPWNLLYVKVQDRPFPGLWSRSFRESDVVTVNATGVAAHPGRKAWFGTISLAPLDAFCIAILHGLLPVMIVLDGYQLWRGRPRYLPRGTLILLAITVYGLILFSVAEGGENMRFRLAIEPALIALSIITSVAGRRAFRAGVEQVGIARRHNLVQEGFTARDSSPAPKALFQCLLSSGSFGPLSTTDFDQS